MIVTAMDTAEAVGSGDVAVLATPRLIALLEAATVQALRGQVPDSHTSVGSHIDVRHRRPTPLGAQVHAVAKVTDVAGVRVTFEVSAAHDTAEGDRVDDIVTGTVTRVLVDRATFDPR